MPKCDGIPGKTCPAKKAVNVHLGKGDLMMCDSCTVVRDYMDDGKLVVNQNKPVKNNGTPDVIVDPLLAYIEFSLPSSTSENVKNAVLGHFTQEEIIMAKDNLWSTCGASLGEKVRCKDSTTRSEKEAYLFDIVQALLKLDQQDGPSPTIAIAAHDLHKIPRAKAEELNSISQVDRLNKLEARMSSLIETVDKHYAENISLKDRV